MTTLLTDEQKHDFAKRAFSRRTFGRLGALLGASAALPFYNESALAQLSSIGRIPDDAVKINANENPMGPCPEAAEAIQACLTDAGISCLRDATHLAGSEERLKVITTAQNSA